MQEKEDVDGSGEGPSFGKKYGFYPKGSENPLEVCKHGRDKT